ncbi:MAG TPA: hypothetical protein VMG12_19350 [Polyangiaceae bacterium]|nr:hypothetical protein [Polyangiaceae bacterium]
MKKRIASFIAPVLFALGASCHDEPEPGPPVTFDPECEADFSERGEALISALSDCTTDADCTISQTAPSCLGPFLCSRAITRGNDAAYQDAASQLVDEYIAECGDFCAVADCVGPDALRAFCDTSIGKCAIDPTPPGGGEPAQSD